VDDERITLMEPFYSYYIRSGWEERAEEPADIGARFLKTLDALGGIDPIFADWHVIDARNLSMFSLDAARSRIVSVIEDNIARDDFDEPAPVYGYRAHALSGEFRDSRSVSFNVHAGAKRECGTKLEFADWDVAPDPAIVTYTRFKAALLAINAIWQAPWACAQAFRSGNVAVPFDLGGVQAFRIDGVQSVPLDPTFPYSIFHIPWIAYLSAPLAAGVKLSPEILPERTPDGGLLMTATKERLDPNNPEHARRARMLAETLIKQTGYSSDYGRPVRNA
jgi:hypothetical protein